MCSQRNRKVGVGYSNDPDSFEAGKLAAQRAWQAGSLAHPSFAIAFCAGGLDHERYLQGLQSVVGDQVPVLGGSAIGVITAEHLSYKDNPAAVAIVEAPDIAFRWALQDGLDRDERACGERLVQQLGHRPEDKALVVFYDSVREPAGPQSPPVLNSSAPILDGINAVMGKGVPIIGAGVIGSYSFGRGRVFAGAQVASQSVVGMVLSGEFTPHWRIMHGTTPLDGIYRKITRIEGANLYELDGEPVAQLLDRLAGKTWRNQHPVNYLTLGVNHGPRYEEPQEGLYVNRLITGVLPNDAGVGMFEPDLHEGEEIQLMFRDTEKMMTSVRANTETLLAQVQAEGKIPWLALYIDCAGRTAEYLAATQEEASILQQILNQHGIPLLGMYSGVEIAPLLSRSRGLDWTGVLLLLATAK